jgi:glucosamine--fructose-6-phosphate aminotransferase (isomerizing)
MTTAAARSRPGHPYHMHDAIYAQPGALRLVGRGNEAAVTAAAAALRKAAHVVVVGTGSSWHAALVGSLQLARRGRLGARVQSAMGAELPEYGAPPDAATSVVAITHRGTPSVIAALAAARAAGAATVAVTSKAGVAGADHVLRSVEPEVSGTHTVSYTSALAALTLLAAAVGEDEELAHALDALPDQVALLLGQESWEQLAARFAERRHYWFVGGGPNRATALEGALKLGEAAGLPAVGVDGEQFLHGAWAAVAPGDLVVAIAPGGAARARTVQAARVARQRGADVLALGAEADTEVDDLVSPIAAVVPLQLLAYHVALVRGRNPDGEPPVH